MIPTTLDITIRFGDYKEIFFRVRDRVFNSGTGQWETGNYRDLTGYTVLSQVRVLEDDAAPILTFTSTLGNQADPVNGTGAVLLKLTGTQTAGVSRTTTKAKWDVQMTDLSGDPATYIAGDVTFVKDVSRVGA